MSPQHAANGGSEFCVGVLAGALAQTHEVEIVHHRTDMSREALAEHCHADLSRVRMRYEVPDPIPPWTFRDPWQYYRKNLQWNAGLSRPYDVFVTFAHQWPPACHAGKGVMVVLFPNKPDSQAHDRTHALERLKDVLRDRVLRKRVAGYQVRTAISEFSRQWTARYWGVDCQIFHPPVDVAYGVREKEDLIVSVGRFTERGVSKHQREMVCTFRQLEDADQGVSWQYACAGGLSDVAEDRHYFEEVRRLADGHRVQMLPSLKRDELKSLYERSAIFWHAAGYSESADARPAAMEHFGITTVEAMAAGCVPVVIKKGGQTEIVQHEVSGFHWDTLEELQTFTALLMRDKALRVRMSEAARLRAQDFSREKFVARFCDLSGLSL